MICPNCGEEMKSIDHRFVGFGDEPDYDTYEHIGDECKKCHIKYNECSHSWELPDILKPTEKQIKTVLFIQSRLDVPTGDLVTKKQYCDFIEKYFDKAKNVNYFEFVPDNFDYAEYGYDEEFY